MFAGWEELQRVARSGRVGRPVFFRCVIACPEAEGPLPAVPGAGEASPPHAASSGLSAIRHAAAAIESAVALIGDPPRTLFARGEPAAGDLHVLLEFDTGATAMIAVGPGEPAWDVMLLGNHGAAYLESGGLTAGYSPSIRGERAVGGRWATVIVRALAEGRPIRVREASDE